MQGDTASSLSPELLSLADCIYHPPSCTSAILTCSVDINSTSAGEYLISVRSLLSALPMPARRTKWESCCEQTNIGHGKRTLGESTKNCRFF